MVRAGLGGWSYVETLVSMAIVFTLSSTVGVVGTRQVERARVAAVRSQLATLELALESYAVDCGRYPSTAQGLAALWERPYLAPIPTDWQGPYLRREPGADPWGNPYRYEQPGPNGLPYLVSSTLGGTP